LISGSARVSPPDAGAALIGPRDVLNNPKITAILNAPYGRFSDQEFARRRAALTAVMRERECDALLICGEQRVGTGVGWLTGWPTTTEALVLFMPGERDVLWVEHYNHVPNARKIAQEADVRWAERRGAQLPIEEARRRGLTRLGVMGALSWSKARQLAAAIELVDLNADYAGLRMRKSDEEIDWMRIGAAFSDLGIAALLNEARPGMTERELGALVERDYLALGGSTVIHFIGINNMADPDLCVPPQFHSSRKLGAGDMMFVEFTASFWDSPGQVLRTIAVGAEPTPLFRELYEVAEAAFKSITGVLRAGVSCQEIVEASGVIEDAGFTIYDDIVHGFGGGYWPPVLGTKSRPAGPVPDMRLEANMTIVVQPNVITRDQKAGVQLGEMVRITPTGFERLHTAPWGFLRIS
jgi:Xaa-Pro aminopeptidase